MRSGFSLIELLVVIVILALLAGLVMPNILGKGEEAKRNLVCVQMGNLAQSLKMFKLDNSMYPETEEGLTALIVNPDAQKYSNYAKTPYLDSKDYPKDPWNHQYIYIKTETGEFELISLGVDGKEGGEGENADIRYSECKKK